MNDCIERKKAIELIQPHVKPQTVYGEGYLQAIEHATDILELMPAADVQPVKRGRWEQIGEQSAKCTACGGVFKSNGIDKTGKALIFNAVYHYCPYCGARMDLKDGDTNG